MGKYQQQRDLRRMGTFISRRTGHFSRLLAIAVCRLRNFRSDPLVLPRSERLFPCSPAARLVCHGRWGRVRRNPTRGVNFAATQLLPTTPGGVPPVNIVLSTRDFNYDFAGAGHILIGHTFNECYQLEGGYTTVGESEDMLAIRDNAPNALGGHGNLFSPFGGFGTNPIAGLDYNNFAQIHYISSLQTGELNIRRQLPMPPGKLTASILFGVRYVDLPEDFYYNTQSDVPAPAGATNAIHVATTNQLIGPQIGALFEFYVENRWWVNFEMKAAVMNNRAEQSTTYHNVEARGSPTITRAAKRKITPPLPAS